MFLANNSLAFIGRVPGTVTRIGYDLNISGLENRFTPTAKNWKDIGNML